MTTRWGYFFLQSDTLMSLKDQLDLVKHATEMYLADQTRKIVDEKTYGGEIKLRGIGQVGSLSGVEFHAKIDSEHGKANISFLINEQTGAGWGDLVHDRRYWN